jgi:glycosyltransferase involved in cell wall biosynthesis
VRGLIGPLPVTVWNYTSAAMKAELAGLLEQQPFDVVQLEQEHLFAYLDVIRRARRPVRVICDWHNIESELMERHARIAAWLPRRLYAARTARLLVEVERRLLEQCEGHVVCSERERQKLLERVPEAQVRVVGNGVDVEFHSDAEIERACRGYPEVAGASRENVVFVGSMDYYANIDAARYFANEVWPGLKARRPGLRFMIVGSRPAPEIVALGRQPGITVTGTVEDVRPYYRNALAVVIPIRVGSGTRLKALEAMAAGVPVVSTTLGIEGIEVSPGENVVLADSGEGLAQAVLQLFECETQWRKLAAGGRELVRARYDWSALGESLYRFHQQVAKQG